MNKKESIVRKSKFWAYKVKTNWGTHTLYTNYDPRSSYYNLWHLADSILAAGEISDVLFKRIGEVLAKRIWFWKSIGVIHECS